MSRYWKCQGGGVDPFDLLTGPWGRGPGSLGGSQNGRGSGKSCRRPHEATSGRTWEGRGRGGPGRTPGMAVLTTVELQGVRVRVSVGQSPPPRTLREPPPTRFPSVEVVLDGRRQRHPRRRSSPVRPRRPQVATAPSAAPIRAESELNPCAVAKSSGAPARPPSERN
jgi:hypothetical protein